MKTLNGTIKEIIADLSSGFISSSGLDDIFFSPKTQFTGLNFKELKVGQKVQFRFIETERGLFASNVAQIAKTAPSKRAPEATI